MQKTFNRDTRTSVILLANWFQFAAAGRALNPRVLSRTLLWCQEGKGRVRVNGVWHEMRPDDFLFLPWQHEVLYIADGRDPFWVGGIHIIPDHPTDRKLVLSVSHNIKDRWAKCSWRRDRAWQGLEGVRTGVARPKDPLRLLATYIVERFDEQSLPEASLRELSHLLVEEIARTATEKPAARLGNDVVRRAQELVDSNWDRQISVNEMARLTQCSVSTLRRQFQQSLGIPPYEWVLQARMRRARRLLVSTPLRVKEIARQVGFDDPFQFSRTFAQRTGSSPRKFRESHAFAPK